MPKLYLLTDENDQSLGGWYWFPGASHSTSGIGRLFGSGWIQCYRNPVVATFLAPIHAGYEHPHLWLCEGDIGVRESDLVFGARKLNAIKRVRLPELSADQRIHLAIMASRKVFQESAYFEWTGQWLDEKNRPSGLGTIRNTGSEAPQLTKVSSDGEREQDTSAKEAALYTSAALLSSPKVAALVPGLCANAVTRAAAVKRIDVNGLAHLALESA